LREDVDPTQAMVSVMSLCVFPFLVRPMLERVMQGPMDADFVARWTEYATELFQRGVRP
jgi:hypothetical protein